jgi:hypothetical protein
LKESSSPFGDFLTPEDSPPERLLQRTPSSTALSALSVLSALSALSALLPLPSLHLPCPCLVPILAFAVCSTSGSIYCPWKNISV